MPSTRSRIDVLVVGGANYDYEIKGGALPGPGATVVGDLLHEGPGGKGANQVVAAARLGAAAAFVGRVGTDDRGRAIVAALNDQDVDASACVGDPDAPTGVALILVDARGEKMIMTAPGANLRLGTADLDEAAPLFASARVVLLQLECGAPLSLEAARRGRAAGARVVLDAAPPAPLPDELIALLAVIRANAGEARVITGVEVTDRDSARRAARDLLRRGAGAACIGASGGDLLVEGDREVWLPHQHVEVLDATGAGDAFIAGIAVGIAEGRSLADAAWLGCAAAAVKLTRVGAQAGLPRRPEVDDFALRR